MDKYSQHEENWFAYLLGSAYWNNRLTVMIAGSIDADSTLSSIIV